MIRTPPKSGTKLPPRPRRPTFAIDDAQDNASGIFSTSGIISETTMASFLIDSGELPNGVEMTPKTASLLRQKQEDARVAIFCLNQFIFQAGNVYRGKRLTRDEENILRESANRVGLSMDIVDALLEHTSDSNAVVNYCMQSNDAFARRIKEDRHLSKLLEQDASDRTQGGFDLKNSIWRIFMHKIVQQALRDNGMDIGDVMSNSSPTSRLYEEALRGRENYLINSAERERIHRDYTEERMHLSLSEEEIKDARRHARSQITFRQNQPFDDLLRRDDVPLMIEGGKFPESRDDDMSLLTCMERASQREERTAPSVLTSRKLEQRKATIGYTPPRSRSRNSPAGKKDWIENAVDNYHRTSAEMTPPSVSRPLGETRAIGEIIQKQEENIEIENDENAPPSAVKRALAMFEKPKNAENEQPQRKAYSTSKAGRRMNSKIADAFAFFDKGTSQENEAALELKPARSSEHTAIQASTLFDVFSTPKKGAFTGRTADQPASTSKISRVKRSQMAVFEAQSFENDESGHVMDESTSVTKLNPEVRRLFDTGSEVPFFDTSEGESMPLSSGGGSPNRSFSNSRRLHGSISRRGPVELPQHGKSGGLSAVQVSILLREYRKQDRREVVTNSVESGDQRNQPIRNIPISARIESMKEAMVSDASSRAGRVLEREGMSYPINSRGSDDSVQNHTDSIDAAFDSISDCSDHVDDIHGLKRRWKNHATPPTSRPKRPSSHSPVIRFNLNDENASPSTSQEMPSPVERISSLSPRDKRGRQTALRESPRANSRTERDAFSNPQKNAMEKMLKYVDTPPKSRTHIRKTSKRSAEMRDRLLANMSQSSDKSFAQEIPEDSSIPSFGGEQSEHISTESRESHSQSHGMYKVKYNDQESLNNQSSSHQSAQHGEYNQTRQDHDDYLMSSSGLSNFYDATFSPSIERNSESNNAKYDPSFIGDMSSLVQLHMDFQGSSVEDKHLGEYHSGGYVYDGFEEEDEHDQVYLKDMSSPLPGEQQSEYRGPGYIDSMLSSLDNLSQVESQGNNPMLQEQRSWEEFQDVFGSMDEVKKEATEMKSEILSSKKKIENMLGTLNQVKDEAMYLERRKPEHDLYSARQPETPGKHSSQSVPQSKKSGDRASQSFLNGVELSGSKAEFLMISDNHDDTFDFEAHDAFDSVLLSDIRGKQTSAPLQSKERDFKHKMVLSLGGKQTNPKEWETFQNDDFQTGPGATVDEKKQIDSRGEMQVARWSDENMLTGLQSGERLHNNLLHDDDVFEQQPRSPMPNLLNTDFVQSESAHMTSNSRDIGTQPDLKTLYSEKQNFGFQPDFESVDASEVNRFDQIALLENEGTFAASTLTFSTASADESEFEAFNFFDSKDAKLCKSKTGNHLARSENKKTRAGYHVQFPRVLEEETELGSDELQNGGATNEDMGQFSTDFSQISKSNMAFEEAQFWPDKEVDQIESPYINEEAPHLQQTTEDQELPAPPSHSVDENDMQGGGKDLLPDNYSTASEEESSYREFTQSNSEWFEVESNDRLSRKAYKSTHVLESPADEKVLHATLTPRIRSGYTSDPVASPDEERHMERYHPNLPAEPSREENDLHYQTLDIKHSSSSQYGAGQIPRVETCDSEQSEETDVGLNVLDAGGKSLDRDNHQMTQDSTKGISDNGWGTTGDTHLLSSAFRSSGSGSTNETVKEYVDVAGSNSVDDEIRSAAMINGVSPRTLDIIMNQTRKQETELSRPKPDKVQSLDPTSWDALVDNDKLTPRMGSFKAKSEAAESTNSLINDHRHVVPTNQINHDDIYSLLPEGKLPPGVTEEEVRLLKRFIDMNFDGHQLTAASQARVRAAAAKVGLSEVLIDQMLEQARLKREMQVPDYHNYHGHQPPPIHQVAPEMSHRNNSKFPFSPGNATEYSSSYVQRERRSRQDYRDDQCYDACQVLGNIKDNLLFFAGCRNDYDDDASSVGR